MNYVRTIIACAALLAATEPLTIATAAPIRTLPNLQSVTIYEITFVTTPNIYAPNDAEITTRRGDPLSASNNDFSFFQDEYYDVFYSDANGNVDQNGAFVTVEGVWRNPGLAGSMNINEVQLTFTDASTDFADFVASFVLGSICNLASAADCSPASALFAVDQNLATFPRFGHTSASNLAERFRLTVGFNGISNVPTGVPAPSGFVALAIGIPALLLLRRRTQTRS